MQHNLDIEILSKSLKTKQVLLCVCSIENTLTEENVDNIFNEYRQKYNININDDWEQELSIFSELFNTTDKFILVAKVKELFL